MSDIQANLKAAVYLAVSTMVEEELASSKTTPSPTFVASLVELVYNQLANLGEDLESFANHAGRVTINPSDLYMITRKNNILTEELKKYENKINEQ
ncbi:inner kinetochore subunit Mhf1p [[Candida] railenensis]|uniref:Inner kinetochore subunit Mhf1p n=1 Tax=[Candida] railenensis TaxID=45579 RepID=A0A9P0VXF3_9ASCO|nr:inner kinetochore subunit Mhf1p [[Candida] railenensis]